MTSDYMWVYFELFATAEFWGSNPFYKIKGAQPDYFLVSGFETVVQ